MMYTAAGSRSQKIRSRWEVADGPHFFAPSLVDWIILTPLPLSRSGRREFGPAEMTKRMVRSFLELELAQQVTMYLSSERNPRLQNATAPCGWTALALSASLR